MLTFKQFLSEENRVLKFRAKGIHHNISINQLKNITKGVKQVRYVIDPDGKLHAGNAMDYAHAHIASHGVNGYIVYKGGKYSHRPVYDNSDKEQDIRWDDQETIKHPLFKKMKKAGIDQDKKLDLDEW